jgi:hypothetical protein
VYHSYFGGLRSCKDNSKPNLRAINLENILNYFSDDFSPWWILVLRVLEF